MVMELLPYIALGVVGLFGYDIYMRNRSKREKKNLVSLEEDIPKDRQPFVFYAGEGGEGYYGRVIWRSSYKDINSVRVEDANGGGLIEIISDNFKEDFQVLPYSDIIGGRVTIACRIDANNRIHDWDNSRLEKLQLGLSEISVNKIRAEERERIIKDTETAFDLSGQRVRYSSGFGSQYPQTPTKQTDWGD